MQQQQIEDRLISSITSSDDLSELVMSGVSNSSFVIRNDIYKFILEYSKNYGNVPNIKVLQVNFPDFAPIDISNQEERKYLIEELQKAEIKRKAIKILNTGSDLLLQDSYSGIEFIISRLSSLGTTKRFSRSYTDKDAINRLSDLQSRKERIASGMIVGLRTGLSFFDDKLLGWQPGNLITIVGRLGVGKSWISLYLGCSAYLDNHRVLFISPEMPIKELELRWDTIMSAMYGHKIPNEELTLGKVDEKKYKEWLEQAAKRSDWLTMDSDAGKAFSVSSVQSIIRDFGPELVIIDGIALMEDDFKSQVIWEAVKNIAYGLKSLAQNNNIVIIVTSQANRDAFDSAPELHQIAYSDAIGQASDLVITVSKNDSEPFTREIRMPKRRAGRTFSKAIKINFNVNEGIIGV